LAAGWSCNSAKIPTFGPGARQQQRREYSVAFNAEEPEAQPSISTTVRINLHTVRLKIGNKIINSRRRIPYNIKLEHI
jgi:hypothetical protein